MKSEIFLAAVLSMYVWNNLQSLGYIKCALKMTILYVHCCEVQWLKTGTIIFEANFMFLCTFSLTFLLGLSIFLAMT